MKTKILVFLFLFLSGWVLADPVGRVESLQGDRKLFRKETDSAKKFLSHIEQDAAVKNRFITDPNSMASIRFFLGGNVGMGKNCEVEIVNEREARVIRQGAYWVKFDPNRLKDETKTVRIQTAGGVMGIRGTEFVIRVQGEGAEQTTELSVIEGIVDVTDVNGEKFEAAATDENGVRVSFGGGQGLTYNLYKIEALMGTLKKDLGPEFEALRSSAREFRKAYRDANLQVRMADLERQRAFASARAAHLAGDRDLRDAEVESGIDMGSVRDRLARADALLAEDGGDGAAETEPTGFDEDALNALLNGEATLEEQPQTSSDSNPTGSELALDLPGHPFLTWPGSVEQRYGVMLLDAHNKEHTYWVDEVVGPSFNHPKEAPPFAPGAYVLRVIPIDSSGNYSEATDYEFQVKG